MRKTKGLFSLIFILFLFQNAVAELPSPREYLGFEVGADRKLADMNQIIDYFMILGEQSPRILVKEVGKTTMGNPFIVAVITSVENHKNLEEYQSIQQKLADPRTLKPGEAEELISQGRAVVMVNCSIHATEIAACQMSMKLAYDLAVNDDQKTQKILDNVVLLLTPMHNPDGIQMVADWYKKHLGTKYEGGRMPWLYHKYVGHDNNRDWFMFTQKETKLTIKVHNDWHPHVIVDMHQMGSTGPRLFVPPFVDPYEPNIDPILRQEVAVMGTFMASELTSEGKAGVMHSVWFDAWTPARAYHHYHGGIRILTEAASVKIATPIEIPWENLSPQVKQESVAMPMPWKGGLWTLGDIVDYDTSAVQAALTHTACLRENWVRNYYRIFKKAVERTDPPYSYIIPKEQRDLSTALKMLNILKMGGVEIHRAEKSFKAEGFQYPEGTFIVYMAQPFGGFAKTLLEPQVYPEIREYQGGPLKTPYDVVGHTLPFLMGVTAIKADEPFRAETTLLKEITRPDSIIEGEKGACFYVWGHQSNDDIVAVNRLLKKGYEVSWAAEEFKSGGKTYPQGTMILKSSEQTVNDLTDVSEDIYVRFEGISKSPGIKVYSFQKPRLGLYKSWTASMDEGWTRFVLEQFEFEYQSVFDEDFRAGNLIQDFDVIIFPSLSDRAIVQGLSEEEIPPKYAGGIGEIGVMNIKKFIQNGGTLITLNSSSEFAVKSLHLGVENTVSNLSRDEFFIPGSLLKVVNVSDHPITYGYTRDAAVFFRRSPVFSPFEGKSVVKYPPDCLLSGWVSGEEHMTGKSALVDIPFGKGRVILIGFPAQYRSQSHGSFKYFFNSLFYGASQITDI
ncbi:MAG: M14 family metallopeptidase [Candidatus Aminicenantes bacterium]